VFFRETLKEHHDLTKFSCGNAELDDWLRHAAKTAAATGTARTFVWLDEDGEVVAYFSLAPHIVSASDVVVRQAKGAPGLIPAILLCKLALARGLQGNGHGGELLVDALDQALDGIAQAGGRLIVVDAIDDNACAFYGHFGFEPTPTRPDRLTIKANTVAKLVQRPWPPP
jgi:GNAT superfamily N-acetyltransferase